MTPAPDAPPQTSTALVAALVAQGALASVFLMGIGPWDGPMYLLALVISVLGLAAIVWQRGRGAVLLAVPVASMAVSAALLSMDQPVTDMWGCSDEQLTLVADLEPPAGMRHRFEAGSEGGCEARFFTEQAPAAVADHYRDQFRQRGWQLRPAQGSSVGDVAAETHGLVVDVMAVGELEEGLVVVSVFTTPD